MKLRIFKFIGGLFSQKRNLLRFEEETRADLWEEANYEAINEMKRRLEENELGKGDIKHDLMISIDRHSQVEKIRVNLNEGIYPDYRDSGTTGLIKID